jgi:hypothetical protein
MSGKHKHVYNILTMARICLSLYIIHRVSSRSNKILMTSYVSFFFILIVFDRAEQTIHFFLIVFDMQWPTRGDEQRRSELTGPWRNDFDIGWGQIMQSWAFVERLRYRHVYTEQILSYLKNSLWHHLSVSGRIWSVWDELGLAGTNRRCFCRYDADLEMIWLEPAAARGQHWQFRSIFRQGYNAGEFLQDSCQPAIGTSAIQFSVKGAKHG